MNNVIFESEKNLQERECRGRWRLNLGLALGLSLGLTAAPMGAWATEVVDQAEDISTETRVAQPVLGDTAIYILGQKLPVSATVSATTSEDQEAVGPLEGTVEFFADDISLGTAELQASEQQGRASAAIETDKWPAGGAYEVSALYTPAEGSGYVGSHSNAVTYRIVDTTRIVSDITLSDDTAAEIQNATLEWSIANIWFSNFTVGFEREAISGNVALPEMTPGSSITERQEYFWRPFRFSQGTGTTDDQGNRIIDFTGTARLTSGSGNQWDFTDPQVHIAASGDGYITAVFGGFYKVGTQQDYGPTRVTIATFNDAQLEVSDEDLTTATIDLNYEGQANGAGTWAMDYNDSFPNEFVALLNPGVSLFFAKSSVATDDSKIPHPITLSFTETSRPTPSPDPQEPEPSLEPSPGLTDDESDEREVSEQRDSQQPVAGSSATPGGGVATSQNSPAPGTKSEETAANTKGGLAATGSNGTVIAVSVGLWLTLVGGVLLLNRRRVHRNN